MSRRLRDEGQSFQQSEGNDGGSNHAMHRIGYPWHVGCVRTRRATGADPVIAIVGRADQMKLARVFASIAVLSACKPDYPKGSPNPGRTGVSETMLASEAQVLGNRRVLDGRGSISGYYMIVYENDRPAWCVSDVLALMEVYELDRRTKSGNAGYLNAVMMYPRNSGSRPKWRLEQVNGGVEFTFLLTDGSETATLRDIRNQSDGPDVTAKRSEALALFIKWLQKSSSTDG